jgi:exodeoxyribonuclease VII small subunit
MPKAKSTKTKDQGKSFEEALGRLQKIVEELEGGELPLESALGLFQEGVDLGKLCGDQLDSAEQRITVLMERTGAADEEVEFEDGDD